MASMDNNAARQRKKPPNNEQPRKSEDGKAQPQVTHVTPYRTKTNKLILNLGHSFQHCENSN